jgi:hypothetical protein
MPYRAMIADLRCATSTSIGDDRTFELYLSGSAPAVARREQAGELRDRLRRRLEVALDVVRLLFLSLLSGMLRSPLAEEYGGSPGHG